MTKSMRAALAAALAAAVALAPAASAQAPRAIKLATVVPEGSIWDRHLKQMADEWQKATSGRVALTVFSGASQGDEPTVLRKMRLDALQAASFTAVGLGTIDEAFNVFDVPFFFESYDELNYVTSRLTPVVARRLDAKGFVLLNWGHGGWTQLFTKRPVQTLAELKRIKLFTSAGNDRMVQWFKANGFEPRPMALTDIMTGLTTGMIEGLPTPALAAQLFQWYRQTPYMLDIGLAPVVGATIVTKKAWSGVAAADRAALLASAAGVEQRLQAEIPRQDQAAVAELMKRGVTVTRATGAEWRIEADALAKTMRGQMVPPDIFDLAATARDEYRKRK
jgi:TRAP-type C4-dicarboxylate transport system substrate-binding protein